MVVPVSARAALLQALMEGPGYGLDLIRRVKERTKGRIVLGQASVYTQLRVLETNELLDVTEGEPKPGPGGRQRQYYKINAKGRQVALEHLAIIADLFGLVKRP